jgi:hypothetical protein
MVFVTVKENSIFLLRNECAVDLDLEVISGSDMIERTEFTHLLAGCARWEEILIGQIKSDV